MEPTVSFYRRDTRVHGPRCPGPGVNTRESISRGYQGTTMFPWKICVCEGGRLRERESFMYFFSLKNEMISQYCFKMHSAFCITVHLELLLSPSLFHSPHDRPVNWETMFEEGITIVIRKLAVPEDGRVGSPPKSPLSPNSGLLLYREEGRAGPAVALTND